jgi:hypothetical protein
VTAPIGSLSAQLSVVCHGIFTKLINTCHVANLRNGSILSQNIMNHLTMAFDDRQQLQGVRHADIPVRFSEQFEHGLECGF